MLKNKKYREFFKYLESDDQAIHNTYGYCWGHNPTLMGPGASRTHRYWVLMRPVPKLLGPAGQLDPKLLGVAQGRTQRYWVLLLGLAA
jgi:hypothetical protein